MARKPGENGSRCAEIPLSPSGKKGANFSGSAGGGPLARGFWAANVVDQNSGFCSVPHGPGVVIDRVCDIAHALASDPVWFRLVRVRKYVPGNGYVNFGHEQLPSVLLLEPPALSWYLEFQLSLDGADGRPLVHAPLRHHSSMVDSEPWQESFFLSLRTFLGDPGSFIPSGT